MDISEKTSKNPSGGILDGSLKMGLFKDPSKIPPDGFLNGSLEMELWEVISKNAKNKRWSNRMELLGKWNFEWEVGGTLLISTR